MKHNRQKRYYDRLVKSGMTGKRKCYIYNGLGSNSKTMDISESMNRSYSGSASHAWSRCTLNRGYYPKTENSYRNGHLY